MMTMYGQTHKEFIHFLYDKGGEQVFFITCSSFYHIYCYEYICSRLIIII